MPVLTNPLIPNAYTIARSRFKSVISQERHALLKKSSSIDHFDYDSDLEDILREGEFIYNYSSKYMYFIVHYAM